MRRKCCSFTAGIVVAPFGIRQHALCARRGAAHSRATRRAFGAVAASAGVGDDKFDVDRFRISESESGCRVDKLLATRFNERSRSYMQWLISEGHVQIDGNSAVTKSYRVTHGQMVAIKLVATEGEIEMKAEDIALDILYEDEHLVFVNKAAGMVTHPAAGNWTGTLVNALAWHYKSIQDMACSRAGIVHRLDKGTSGVMVVAKHREAVERMSRLFAERKVRKEYVAITVGNPAGQGCIGGVIEEPVGRNPQDRLRMCVLAEENGGRYAKSVVETIAHDSAALLHVVKVRLETGRTHQIRVHLRHKRTPVLGDDIYGAVDVNRRFCGRATRPLLHAWRVSFTHPMTKREMSVSATIADDMRDLIKNEIYPSFERDQMEW